MNIVNEQDRTLMLNQRATRIALDLVVALLLITLLTAAMQAQTYTVLYSFTGGADGGIVTGGLIQDISGNFYGTASAGGNLACSVIYPGCGVVFKLTLD